MTTKISENTPVALPVLTSIPFFNQTPAQQPPSKTQEEKFKFDDRKLEAKEPSGVYIYLNISEFVQLNKLIKTRQEYYKKQAQRRVATNKTKKDPVTHSIPGLRVVGYKYDN